MNRIIGVAAGSILLFVPVAGHADPIGTGICAAYQNDPDNEQLNKDCRNALRALKAAKLALEAAQRAAFGTNSTTAPAVEKEASFRALSTPKAEPAQPETATADQASKPPPKVGGTGDNEENSFGGIKFGAGIGFTYDLGSRDRISEAVIDGNGVVRAKKLNNLNARLLLESHYFFTPGGKVFGLEQGDWGIGPFIALQGGSEKVIEGIGAGMMFGMKRLRANAESAGPSSKDNKTTDNSSFNVGLGVFYDLNVKTLGDGIKVNERLPAGDELRYTDRSQSGLLIMTSFTF